MARTSRLALPQPRPVPARRRGGLRLLRWGARRPALRESLLQAAILWTGIALTLATLSYPTL